MGVVGVESRVRLVGRAVELEVSLAELALLAGRNPAQLVPALAVAADAGLLTESGDRLTFRHIPPRSTVSGPV